MSTTYKELSITEPWQVRNMDETAASLAVFHDEKDQIAVAKVGSASAMGHVPCSMGGK